MDNQIVVNDYRQMDKILKIEAVEFQNESIINILCLIWLRIQKSKKNIKKSRILLRNLKKKRRTLNIKRTYE